MLDTIETAEISRRTVLKLGGEIALNSFQPKQQSTRSVGRNLRDKELLPIVMAGDTLSDFLRPDLQEMIEGSINNPRPYGRGI